MCSVLFHCRWPFKLCVQFLREFYFRQFLFHMNVELYFECTYIFRLHCLSYEQKCPFYARKYSQSVFQPYINLIMLFFYKFDVCMT